MSAKRSVIAGQKILIGLRLTMKGLFVKPPAIRLLRCSNVRDSSRIYLRVKVLAKATVLPV